MHWNIIKSYNEKDARKIVEDSILSIKSEKGVYEENYGWMGVEEGFNFYFAIFKFDAGDFTDNVEKTYIPAIGVIKKEKDNESIVKFTIFNNDNGEIYINKLINLDIDNMSLVEYYGKVDK